MDQHSRLVRSRRRPSAWTAVVAVVLVLAGSWVSPSALRRSAYAADTVHTVSDTYFLYGIDCVDGTRCVAVGTSAAGGVVVPIVDGVPGAAQVASGSMELRGVDCVVSTTTCIAVGYAGTSTPYAESISVTDDGSVTLAPDSPCGSGACTGLSFFKLWGVSCATVTSCIAAGTDTYDGWGVVWSWNETSMAETPYQATTRLDAVACLSATQCIATGRGQSGDGVAVRYPALTESDVFGTAYDNASFFRLTDVECGAASCLAIGYGDVAGAMSVVLTPRDDGTVDATDPNDLGTMTLAYGATCVSSATCVVVGQQGGGTDAVGSLAVLQNGVTTTTRAVTGTTTLSDVRCATDECRAVGFTTTNGVAVELPPPDETPPVITSVSPSHGIEAGGTTVTVTGTDLANTTSVTFGGVAGTALACTATTCTVTSPAGTNVADVVATSEGGRSAAETFTYVHSVAVSPDATTASAGQDASFKLVGTTADGASSLFLTDEATLAISPDGTCTAPTSTSTPSTTAWTCSATTAGSHTIAGSWPSGSAAALTDTATFTVEPAAVSQLDVSPSTSTVTAGGSQTYTAVTRDTYGNLVNDVTSLTTFSLSDGSCEGAVCSATTAGLHTVTATWTTYTDTATLTVEAGPLARLAVTPDTTSTVAGTAVTFAAEGYDAYGNDLGSKTLDATWSISPDGSCHASSCGSTIAGPHTVTATTGTVTGDATMTITPGALDHLVVSPSTATVIVGAGQTYSATGIDKYGNTIGDVTESTTFRLGDAACASSTCTPTSVGTFVVSALNGSAAGAATLTSTYDVERLPPDAVMPAGATIPIKVQLLDASGANVSSPNTTVTLVDVDPSPPTPINDSFRYDEALGGSGGGYQYNLRTRGWEPGTYTLYIKASGDPVQHIITITLQ